MNREEARADLMLAQADISYRPKDDSIDMAIEALNNQKTGHWVEIDDYPHEDFECDCCGGKVYGTEEPYEEYKYCPNCGAKMKGE